MWSQNEARSFLQNLLQNLPTLPFEPALLPMLFAATKEDSNASMGELVALIERSQKLTVRVLAMANSASYGQEFQVSTLHRAINILGISEIRILLVIVGMSSIIKRSKLPANFDINELWDHQFKVATIAKVLAAELGGCSGLCGPGAAEGTHLIMAQDEAYIAGLLHDIGKILFAASRPDLWEEINKNWNHSRQAYFEAENACWGIDHALIGARVLHHWQLPSLLTEPINWHHAPELAPVYKMETRLLAAANYIGHSESARENGLCEEAILLLPQEIDAVAIGTAIKRALANATDLETFTQ